MEVTYNTRFLLRRGTAEAWEHNNPVLSYGEPGYDSTNYGLKIGDGVTPWKDLEYIGLSQEDLAKAIEDYFKENPGSGTGADGRGIVSIIKTKGNGAPGTIDTYTITYTDYTTSTFTVYNGKDGKDGIGQDGFSPVAVVSETPEGAVVEISDKNGTTSTFIKHGKDGENGDDGRGIASIERIAGNGAPGTQDTYQINYSDGSNFTFQIYNGKDGNVADYEQRESQIFQVSSYELLPTNEVYIGDFGIVKTLIHSDKYSYSAYVYTESGWAAMDGNYSADNVYFDEDILVTTKIGTIQTLTNGQATLSAKGKNLMTVLSSLMAERKNPSATLPSGTVELTNQPKGSGYDNYLVEIGSSVTPSWKTSFSAGSYTYGPATGSTATAATVTLSTDANNKAEIAAGAMSGKTGTLTAFTVADDTKHYVKVAYGWNAGTSTPIDNFGDEYTDTSKNLPIQAASNKSDTSTYYIQGYRKAFHGSKTSPVELVSANIRQLTGNAASDSTLTVTVVEGAKQVIIAVPANRKVTKVADEAAFGTDIFEKFESATVSVGGADATANSVGNYATNYTVYTYNPSTALGANTYTVTLANA